MSAPEPLSAARRAELRAIFTGYIAYSHEADRDRRDLLALLDQADEAARLAGEVERLRAALATYGLHLHVCEAWTGGAGCTCGLRAALTPPEPSGGEA